MSRRDDNSSGTSATEPENGSASPRTEAANDFPLPFEVICFDPQDRAAPCPVCGGAGVYTLDVEIGDPRFGRFQRCPNHPVKNDVRLQERLRRFAKLGAFSDKTFASFHTDLGGVSYKQPINDVLTRAKDAAQRFADNPRGWLVFEGNYGSGKTHLAVAIANQRMAQNGERVLYITAPDLLDLLRTGFDSSTDTSYDAYFEQIRNIPLLVLDDLGVEKPSDWAVEKLFQLLNHRQVADMPTVITTNSPLAELDPRISSRILHFDLVTRVRIDAPDYRKTMRAQSGEKSSFDRQLYELMTFETFNLESRFGEQLAALSIAKQVAEKWAAKPKNWLYLTGDYGTGKTHLTAAIAHRLYEQGYDIIFATMQDLLDYLDESYDRRANARLDERLHEVVNAPVLLLDDLRLANASLRQYERIFQILDKRYLLRKPTVISSSEPTDSDERLATRLNDKRICKVIELRVDSYVKRHKLQT